MPNFNYNRIALGGRLTDEPELRQTQSGKPVANFRIAVGRRFKPQDAQEPQYSAYSPDGGTPKFEDIKDDEHLPF